MYDKDVENKDAHRNEYGNDNRDDVGTDAALIQMQSRANNLDPPSSRIFSRISQLILTRMPGA